jgi:hypothetical protein
MTTAPKNWWEHLASCKGTRVSTEHELYAAGQKAARLKIQQTQREAAAKIAQAKAHAAMAAPTAASSAVAAGFAQSVRAKADTAVARLIYGASLPLSIVEDSLFRDCLKAAARAGPSYRVPTRKRVSGELLDEQESIMKKAQNDILEQDAIKFGSSVVSDGWKDSRRRQWINVVRVSPRGEFCVAAIDTTGNRKTKEYIATLIKPYLQRTVDLVVMDGACEGALKLIQSDPDLQWINTSKCTTHQIDLLIEALGEKQWAK